ncbi:MAG: hypothetical protein EOP84_08900 [Verrucomicrobiaceae bacterium]|nr:MAG: hypothetical protein EOP84_08900 [Verrucomicrobiaceae bacterium]
MAQLTTRDKWLAAALPAMVTLLAGWLFVTRPAGRELSILRQRVESQGPLATQLALVVRAQEERSDLEKLITEKRNAVPEDEAVFNHNLALQQVSVLCATHGLSLNSTLPETGGRLSSPLEEASVSLRRAPNATQPQVWRIELSGHYPSILKLLQDLQRTKPLIVPLNLSMQANKNVRKPATWVLTLWL